MDVYFGPKAPKGMEKNWVPTNPDKGFFVVFRFYGPGKSWFIALRIYGPEQPWIDQTWRPGEIELVK